MCNCIYSYNQKFDICLGTHHTMEIKQPNIVQIVELEISATLQALVEIKMHKCTVQFVSIFVWACSS